MAAFVWSRTPRLVGDSELRNSFVGLVVTDCSIKCPELEEDTATRTIIKFLHDGIA